MEFFVIANSDSESINFTNKGEESILQQHSNMSAKTHSVESVTFPKDSDKELLAKLLEAQQTISKSSTDLKSTCELDQMVHQQNILSNHQSEAQSNLFCSTDQPGSGKHPFRIIWPELDSSEGERVSKERRTGENLSPISLIRGFEHDPLSGLKSNHAEHIATEPTPGSI